MDEKTTGRIRFMVNLAYYIVIGAIAYFVLKYVTGWLMPFLLAFLLVSIVHPLIRRITDAFKLKHEIVAFLIMALLYILTAYGIFLIIVRIFYALRNLFSGLPEYYESTIVPLVNSIGNALANFSFELPFDIDMDLGIELSDILSNLLGSLQLIITKISQGGISFISAATNSVPSFIIAFIFMIMMSFFISMQYDKVVLFIKAQLNDSGKKLLTDFKKIFIDTVLKYVQAYLKLMLITFIELSIGFTVLGLENSIAMAAGIAVFDALPVFGTGGIMIPWIIIELLQANYRLAMGLAIVYGVITLIRNIIEPKIVGDQLGLNPIVSLIAIYLGFKIFGVFGMIFMPIVFQIIIALQKNGNIHIFNEISVKEGEKGK